MARARSAASVLLALIAAVAFATILAVVAGLTLTSASSVAHDLYANVIAKGKASEQSELIVVRIAALRIGAVAIALAIPAQRLNIAFLVALAFAVAASANLPALLFNLFWKRFNTAGAICEHLRRLDLGRRPGDLLPGRVRHADLADHRTPTSPGSRCATRASCRSRSASSAASWAPCSSRDKSSRGPLPRARGPLPHRRRRREGRHERLRVLSSLAVRSAPRRERPRVERRTPSGATRAQTRFRLRARSEDGVGGAQRTASDD